MHSPSLNGHGNDLTLQELKCFQPRPSANPRKAQKTIESIIRQSGKGTPFEEMGSKALAYTRMTDGHWKINGRMPHIQEQFSLPYRNGLPRYEAGSGFYTTESTEDERTIPPEEASRIMQELKAERTELRKVFMQHEGKPEGEEYVEAADTLADAVEKAYPREYYG